MHKVIIVIIASVFSIISFAQESISKRVDIIIPALIKVESNGNDKAIGDAGKAKGCLQIWDITVQEVNRIAKLKKMNKIFSHNDAFNHKKSIEMCKIYLDYWGNWYEDKFGVQANYEVLAKMWNGGPKFYVKNGKAKENLDSYWNKVKIELEKR